MEDLRAIFEKYEEVAESESNQSLYNAIQEIKEQFNYNEYEPMRRDQALKFGLSLINGERIKCAPGRNSYLKNEIEEKAGIDLAMQHHYYNRYNRCVAAMKVYEEMLDELEVAG